MSRRVLVGVAVTALAVTTLSVATPSSAAPEEPEGLLGSGNPGKEAAELGLGLEALLTGEPPEEAGEVAIVRDGLAVRDDRGRVRVRLTPQEAVDRADFRVRAEQAGLAVDTADPVLGTLEGFVARRAVEALRALPGTGTLNLATAPVVRRGDATSQGVELQRVDRVQRRGVDGRGVTVGILSDSFDTASLTVTGEPLEIRAADDVASGDLPGRGNRRYPQPVVVVEDYDDLTATDEGRAMAQIVHDVAPGARLCFATAFTGLTGFADNVRRLADPAGPCAADVVVDDVGYLDEQFYSDSVLSDAIRDVTEAGVHYLSAAGNDGDHQTWEGPLRLVGPRAATTVDLSQVPEELYDGGLADLRLPGTGGPADVAQDLTVGEGGAILSTQWEDPVDLAGATYGEPWLTAAGEVTEADPDPSLTVPVPEDRVGQATRFLVTPLDGADLVVTLTLPDGTSTTVDDSLDAEQLVLTLPEAGDYELVVEEFGGGTGAFAVEVAEVVAPSRVGTDLNLLLFDAAGDFLGAIADANALTGVPQELSLLEGPGEIQLVVGRSGTGRPTAARLRTQLLGDGVMTEHADPLAPAVTGHVYAPGAIAVAAYDPFRPFLPESFTSPGGDVRVVFDSAGERYPRPQVRRVPQVAATDGVNTTFFGQDTVEDDDDLPNFFGTSAAAPHAAAIAALTLQRAGGGQALSPARLLRRLEGATYDHDLDPFRSEGRAGGITLRASGAQGNERSAAPPHAMVDDRFFSLSYDGAVPLRSLRLFGETASPTAPGARLRPLSDGIVFDPRPLGAARPWRDAGFPFTVGATSGGLRADRVEASFSQRAGEGQFRRMTLDFRSNLKRGQSVDFGVDRDLALSLLGGSVEGNGADELGGAVFYPQDKAVPLGLAFEGVRVDGRRIYGVMRNDLGSGWTPVDGHGLVDAERAVFGR